VLDLALADHGHRHVGQRGEVARGAHRALRRHHGVDPAVDEVEQPLDQGRPHARCAERQRLRAQQQHAAHHLGGEGGADADGVRQIRLRCSARSSPLAMRTFWNLPKPVLTP
jgi:hypothetical protein